MATRRWLAASVLLATVFVLGNWPAVTGKAAAIWDAESFFAPAYTLIADHARVGRIVLWNPWQSGGSPDFAEPELGNASPLTIAVGAFMGGTESGYRAYWLLVWFLGPLGVLFLARHLKTPAWAGLVVALGFAFCGFYTGHAEHMSSLYSLSFIPWFLWRFDVALTSQRLWPAVEAGALWGFSSLAGYPELTILSAGFLFLWAVGRVLFPPDELALRTPAGLRTRALKAWLGLVLLACIGSLVLAPTYYAFFSEGGSGYSDRVGPRSREEAIGSGPIEPGALLTFSSPYLTNLKFYNKPGLWKTSDISETNIYVGALITILAVLAIVAEPKSRWRWWLLTVAVFFGVCAVGKSLPVRGWLYDYCPPTRYFRNPALFRAYVIMCAVVLALLAAKDLDRAIRASSARIWKSLFATSAIICACAVTAYVYVISSVKNTGPWTHRADKHLAWVWFGSVVLAAAFLYAPRLRKLLPALFIILAIVDAALTIRVAQATVFSTGHARVTWTWINARHKSSLIVKDGLEREVRPLARIGGAKNNTNVPLRFAAIFNNYSTMWNRFLTDYENHPVLVDMCTGRDRIWFSSSVAMVRPTDRFYGAFVKRSEELAAPVLVVHPPEDMKLIAKRNLTGPSDGDEVNTISHLSAAQRVATTLIRYTPNHLDFEVSAPQTGWLLVTDRWSRGWRAQVNGKVVPVFGGDFLFRAVPVGAGVNKVSFSYRPSGFPLLLIVSWGLLAAVAVLDGYKGVQNLARFREAHVRIVPET